MRGRRQGWVVGSVPVVDEKRWWGEWDRQIAEKRPNGKTQEWLQATDYVASIDFQISSGANGAFFGWYTHPPHIPTPYTPLFSLSLSLSIVLIASHRPTGAYKCPTGHAE